MSNGKINFAVNLPLKLLRATVTNTDTGSRRSPHTLFDMYLDHMLTKFEANRKIQNVELFDKKQKSF